MPPRVMAANTVCACLPRQCLGLLNMTQNFSIQRFVVVKPHKTHDVSKKNRYNFSTNDKMITFAVQKNKIIKNKYNYEQKTDRDTDPRR